MEIFIQMIFNNNYKLQPLEKFIKCNNIDRRKGETRRFN